MQAARLQRHINKDCLRMLILFSPINAANSITRRAACRQGWARQVYDVLQIEIAYNGQR
jgi:hypothetical protein